MYVHAIEMYSLLCYDCRLLFCFVAVIPVVMCLIVIDTDSFAAIVVVFVVVVVVVVVVSLLLSPFVFLLSFEHSCKFCYLAI